MLNWLSRPGVVLTMAVALGTGMAPLTPDVRAHDLIAQDLDRDFDVDRDDFILLMGCLTGSGIPHDGSPTCSYADTDQDGDVDLVEFGIWQRCLSGSNNPADPNCGGCALPEKNLTVGVSYDEVPIGQSSNLVVDDTQIGAVYQLRREADDTPVGAPVPGNGGTILLSTGPLNEATAFNVLAINEIWGCSVELTTTASVDVFPYVDNNKIGVHVVIGSRNGFGPFLADCHAAGKPVAIIKCVDDYGAAYEAKVQGKSPNSVTIGRQNTLDGHDLGNLSYRMNAGYTPEETAQWFFNLVKPKWQANPWIDIWEVCNEWDSDYPWQADFYIALMDKVEPYGYRLALWSSSVGTPGVEHYPDIARTCLRAKQSGDHIMSLHEYAFFTTLLQNAPTSMVTRYRQLYNYLATQGAVVPLALTEVGQGGGYNFVGTTDFVNDFGWYDDRMREDWYVIGCAAWTLGNWDNANFEAALPALANYIINKP